MKRYALSSLPEITSPSGPFFHFALHKNPGVAFGAPVPLPIVIIITLVAFIVLIRIIHQEWVRRPFVAVGALFIFFGALGNLLDRIIHGFTIDYLVIFSRSVINFSDILILLGLFILLRYHTHIPTNT